MQSIQLKILDSRIGTTYPMPDYATDGSAGMDLRAAVAERVDDEYGLDIPILNIVNISLPEEVEQALDTRTSMGVIGDLSKYTQYQTAEAMRAHLRENPQHRHGSHRYSLEEYGLSADVVRERLADYIERFGLPAEGEGD